MINELCLCGSTLEFSKCCERYHRGEKNATTAEQLMRSRFTAYAKQNSEYLLASWDASKRPQNIDFSKEIAHWFRLEILNVKKGGIHDDKGLVEFKAYYRLNEEEYVMHELSRFKKSASRWFYLDGTVKSLAKVNQIHQLGKNALCNCGSGKKFKRCCGATSLT
jgi:SEC-C motif-containing protein